MSNRVVRQYGHRSFDALHVFHRGVDEQIDVFRRANEAVQDDRETADQDVSDAFGIL